MKKIMAILLVLVLAIGMTACNSAATTSSPSPSQSAPSPAQSAAAPSDAASAAPQTDAASGRPAPSDTDKLVIAHKGDPTGLFTLATTAVSTNGPINVFLNDTLVHWNSVAQEFEPMIATEWKYIDDTHIEFKLRDDVYAHDGSHITASDVIYTFQTGSDQGFLGNYLGKFDIPNCKAVDEYTVVLATKVAEPYIFYTLGNAALGIVSQKAVEAGGGVEQQLSAPSSGCGPYKFVKWERGTAVILERNDNYYGDKAYFKTVEFRIIGDASARLMNLQSGDVDVALDPVASQVSQLQGDTNFTVQNVETATLTTMYLNCSGSFAPFSDANVRRAIALALNYDANRDVAVGEFGNTSDSFLSKLSPAYSAPGSTDKNYYHYDVAAAKEMLAQSGYPDGFTFSLKYAENSMFKALAELIQNQLKEINITVQVTPEDSSVFSKDIAEGNFEAQMINSSNPDPAAVMNLVDGRNSFQQVRGGAGWQGTEEVYKLMDIAKGTIDEATRYDAYKKIQSIVNEACPVVPLVSQNRIITTVSSLQGITLTVFTDVDLSRAYRVG
ncbi:MAG: ABC transporter substrate-binding protein [Clostridiales bacterium]|nr:ABC transporter substrate-binding protein [Clostridiales bacterium]